MGELVDKIKGKAKQAAGRATNDKGMEAEGHVDEAKGDAKGAFEELKTDVKRAVRNDDDDISRR